MLRYTFRRIVEIIPTILMISIVVFLFVRMIPGDPARLVAGEEATLETVERIRSQLGLDKPIHFQYVNWLFKVFQGDFGTSLKSGRTVAFEIGTRYGNTMKMAGYAIIWSVLVGITIGVWSGVYRSKWQDYIGMTFSIAGQAVPSFWIGLMLIMVFAVGLRWFPVTGADTPRHFVLPVLTLGFGLSAIIARFTRSSIIEALKEDYTRTARAKGLKERMVIWKHVFRNSMISVVTVVGLQFGGLLGGSVLVEAVFGFPGLGTLMINSIGYRDYPTIQALILVFSLHFVIINLVVDMIYAALDPEIKFE